MHLCKARPHSKMSGFCRQVARFAPSLVRSLTSTPPTVIPTSVVVKLIPVKMAPISEYEVEMMHQMSLQHAFPWTVPRPKFNVKPIIISNVDCEEISYLEEMANKQSQCHFK